MPDSRAILLRAADLIEERGWTRGYEREGRICVMHAIRIAGGEGLYYQLCQRVAEHVGTRFAGLGAWNDAQPSCVPVLRALREAAE